jgi:hypothetical protein
MWFLLIPPVAVLITLVWLVLRNRPPRQEAMITIEGYRRGMAALARSMDVPRQPTGPREAAPGRLSGPSVPPEQQRDRPDGPVAPRQPAGPEPVHEPTTETGEG